MPVLLLQFDNNDKLIKIYFVIFFLKVTIRSHQNKLIIDFLYKKISSVFSLQQKFFIKFKLY